MTGVDPMRWAEVRRRIAAVRSFLAIARPTAADREAAAASINLSSKSFMRLVRSWSEHGEARRLLAASTKGGTKFRSDSVTEAARAAVRVAVANAPEDETLVDLTDRVAEICDLAGTKAPSKSTVWNIVRRERLRPDDDHNPKIVIGSATAMIPVLCNNDLRLPRLTLALAMPERAIITRIIAFDTMEPAYGAVAAKIATGSTINAAPRRLIIPGITSRRERILANALGDQLGNLRLVYRVKSATKPDDLLRSHLDEPLSPDDAATYIDQAIAAHNSQTEDGQPPQYSLI